MNSAETETVLASAPTRQRPDATDGVGVVKAAAFPRYLAAAQVGVARRRAELSSLEKASRAKAYDAAIVAFMDGNRIGNGSDRGNASKIRRDMK